MYFCMIHKNLATHLKIKSCKRPLTTNTHSSICKGSFLNNSSVHCILLNITGKACKYRNFVMIRWIFYTIRIVYLFIINLSRYSQFDLKTYFEFNFKTYTANCKSLLSLNNVILKGIIYLIYNCNLGLS